MVAGGRSRYCIPETAKIIRPRTKGLRIREPVPVLPTFRWFFYCISVSPLTSDIYIWVLNIYFVYTYMYRHIKISFLLWEAIYIEARFDSKLWGIYLSYWSLIFLILKVGVMLIASNPKDFKMIKVVFKSLYHDIYLSAQKKIVS